MKYAAIIPARGGSKGIPKKNIVNLCGFPLLSFSIDTANQVFRGNVFVSTDDADIKNVAESHAATVIRRPVSMAQDDSTDLDWARHAFSMIDAENLVILRPTTPFRESSVVTKAIFHFEENPSCTSLRSAHPLSENPSKMVELDEQYWTPYAGSLADLDRPRQSFCPIYHPNGYVDIVKRSAVTSGSLYGDRILAFITPKVIEIDTKEDLEMARLVAKNYKPYTWGF